MPHRDFSVVPCFLVIPRPFCYSLPSPPPRLFSWVSVLRIECPEGRVFARGPKLSFPLELGLCLWGWRDGGGDGPADAASHKCRVLIGRSRSRVHAPNEVATPQPFSWHSAQPGSHSYSALSVQYRLPLLTSLMAFSQSPGCIFDESIKILCVVQTSQAVSKSDLAGSIHLSEDSLQSLSSIQ